MGFSEPFIRRPIATSLLALAIILAGSAAYTLLPVAPLPRVDMPTISVTGALPGASPETMASAIATPLERRFGRIAGLNEITSTSSLGSSRITLQFDLDRNVDAAARDVQAAINASAGDLPPNLPSLPTYKKVNSSDSPILILALNSKTVPLGQVYDQANTVLAQKVSQIPGVGQVTVSGGQQPAVRIQVDPLKLAGLGLSLEDVRAAVASQTTDEPEGVFTGHRQATVVSANDQLFVAADYKDVVITYQHGAPVRLSDVAKVIDSVENNRLAAWSDGRRSILLIVRRAAGANIIDVIDRTKALLPTLALSISPAIDIHIALDRTTTIRASVHDVERTLFITIALVVMVVFLFLRRAWATVIPSVAVPLSLIGTFGVMYLLDYSIDNLSLMALTISTGFVVDDAIVMIENIARYIEMGDKPFDAALKGARQIGFTIISITISLLAVFLPILFMGGIMGRLIREFAVTLAVAVSVSAVVSLTLTPMMSARFLQREDPEHQGALSRVLERGFDWMHHRYETGLHFVLRHRRMTLGVAIGMVGLTYYLFKTIPFGFFPQQDTGLLAGATQAAQDVSFEDMSKQQEKANQIVQADPAVDYVNSFIGASNGSAGNSGFMFVQLKPLADRKVSVDQVITRLRPKLRHLSGINVFLQAVQDVRVGGRLSQSQYQYSVVDADLNELSEWAPRLLEVLKKIPQIKDVASDQQTAGLQETLVIDRDTAARMGISAQNIDDTLYDAFGQRQIATTYDQINQYHIVLEVRPEFQRNPDSLNDIYVRSSSGAQVPLSAFTRVLPTPTSLSIGHQGQFPCVTLSFNLAPGVALGEAIAVIEDAENEIHLPGSIHASFQGTAQAFKDSISSTVLLLLAALLTVYVVLGILYESLIHPITIISTLPSAGVGAFLMLKLTNTDFTIIALIGMILLIGIVKKNAIMMIDFALEAEREEGLSSEESIVKACLLRFRPIMMTTMAALLGGLPLALGTGTGSELRRPLGIAIVGGLIVSQMLTLFTTPVVYLYMDKLSSRNRKAKHAGTPVLAKA